MHVNCADFVYKAMGELIQVLYRGVKETLKKEIKRAIDTP